MSNVFTETTHQSWFSRIGNSIKGILIGGIVILVSFPLLFWNEGRAVKTARSLDEGEGATRSVASERVDPVNDGQLVHVTGTAITSELLSDAEFGIEVNAIRLRRITEMYQWTEDVETRKKKKLGGGTTTEKTYTYETVWSDDAIDSKRFHHSEGHENPGRMLFPAKVISAKAVTVGAFQLPESMVGQISGSESVVLNESNIPESMSDRMTLVGSDTLFVGQEIQNPQVGDTRVRFVMTPSNQISLIAQQAGETFKPYQTHAGRALSMLEMGTHDAAEMFQHARQANTALTWILRIVGCGLMLGGFTLLTRPLAVLADVIPLLGGVVGAGGFLIGLGLTMILAPLTIATAWMFYRPLVAVPLLMVVGAGVYLLVRRNRKSKEAVARPVSSGVMSLDESDVVA